MSDTLTIQRGQSIGLAVNFYQDAEKTQAIDLTGATVTVRESSAVALKSGTVTVTDAEDGAVTVSFPESLIFPSGSSPMKSGRTNWFTVEADFGGSNIVTPKIWIQLDD